MDGGWLWQLHEGRTKMDPAAREYTGVIEVRDSRDLLVREPAC